MCWSRGVILELTETQTAHILYNNDSNEAARYVNLINQEIAPLGQFSTDYDWRLNLKKGDLVDCCDESTTWYKSVILDIEIKEVDKKQILLAKIAFRNYHE